MYLNEQYTLFMLVRVWELCWNIEHNWNYAGILKELNLKCNWTFNKKVDMYRRVGFFI